MQLKQISTLEKHKTSAHSTQVIHTVFLTNHLTFHLLKHLLHINQSNPKRPSPQTPPPPPLKIANINFRSIRGEKPQFYSFLDFHNPDIVIGTETWFTPDIHDSELIPPDLGYTVYRRDRTGPKGGGVIILVKSSFQSQAKPEFNTNAEIIWIQLNLIGSKSALIGAYYNPHELDQTSFDELGKSLNLIKQSNSQIWLLGDFNLPKIDWELLTPTPDCDNQTFFSFGPLGSVNIFGVVQI